MDSLDYNLQMNVLSFPFWITYTLHKISICSENMLASCSIVPDGMKSSSKRNTQNAIIYQQQWNSSQRPTQNAMEY